MSEITWWTELSEVDRDSIAAVLDSAAAADGTAPVGDQVRRQLHHDRTGHLVAKVDGEIVGYLDLAPATEDAPAMVEVVVAPASRRRGIGSELIGIGLAKGGAGTRVWAHGNLEPARATANALGLVAARELLQMRRPLADLPAVPPRDGVLLRTYAGEGDDAELLRVNNAAFSWHPEQGGWTEADLEELRGEPWFDDQGLFLAFDEKTGKLLGFHWTKIHDRASDEGHHGPKLGEVYVVGVDPAAQGRGLGAVLTLVGLHYLAERLGASEGRSEATRGMNQESRSEATRGGSAAEVTLYVEADNSAAVKTYERLGFSIFAVDVAYTPR